MPPTGSCSFNQAIVSAKSISLGRIEDVDLTGEANNHLLLRNETVEDAAYADGFVNKERETVALLENVNTADTPNHNQLFTYSALVSSWTDNTLSDLLDSFEVTVEGLVSIQRSIQKGLQGNPGLSDLVAFTDVVENGFTMGICSAGDNNAVFKRELTDADFVFMAVLNKGEIRNLSYPKGTIFRSTKGLSGFSSTFPTPMGISSLSSNYFRFYAFRQDVFVAVASAGLETVVTLYSSNGSTVVDGPTTLSPYGSTTLACNANAEFIVVATENVYCATFAEHTTNGLTIDQRLVPPMATEMIVWNRFARVTAQETNTAVRWYRQNGDTGVFTVNAGTPIAIYTGSINEEAGPTNCGSSSDYAVDGCLILRADKPISAFSGADGAGWCCTPCWPLKQLAQLFPNPANLNDNTRGRTSSVTIGSNFEGNFKVFDSSGTLLATIPITRPVTPATTADEQLYPAAGQFQPADIGLANWLGGWVEVNVPSFCVMNFSGSSVWTSDAGDEMAITGVTPAYLRAGLIRDSAGLYRRRDIDAAGVESWNVC